METVPADAMKPAGTDAVTVPGEGWVVSGSVPFPWDVQVSGQFAAVAVRVKPAEPAVADVGDSAAIAGGEIPMIWNASGRERAVLLESVTCTETKPGVARLAAGITAESAVELPKVVASAAAL